MSKLKITDELLARAVAVFKKDGSVYSGQGLSRNELRLLERTGLVVSGVGGGIHGHLSV